MGMLVNFVLVVEDKLSEAVMLHLMNTYKPDCKIDRIIISGGFGQIKTAIPVYRKACRVIPHVVLTDLDNSSCAAALMESWGLKKVPRELLFRVAVREVEAWLLADREGIASFLGISATRIPSLPDEDADPKATLLAIARRSRNKRLVKELAPEVGSRAKTGPLYNQRMCGFVHDLWDVERAAAISPSLARTILRIANFLKN